MFAQRSPIIIIQNVISAIFGMMGMYFIIKFIGTTDWGFLAFGLGFVGIFSIVGDLGFSTAHTIMISGGEDIGECNATYLSVKLVMGAAFSGMVFLALFVWIYILHRGFQSDIEYWVVIALIPYFFFKNLTVFSSAYYVATLKSVRNAIPPLIEAVFRNSVFVGMALLIGMNPGYHGYVDAMYLAMVYSFSYGLYFLVSIWLGRPWKIGKASMKMAKKYSVIAFPLIFALSVGSISGNIDKVMIQFYWHAVPTGAFYSAQQIAAIITTLSASMSVFFVPLLIRYERTSGKLKHNESILEFERLISLYTLPLVVPLSILSPFVMNFFTVSYIPYGFMLSLLAWRAYFTEINTPSNSSIISRKKTKLIAVVDTLLIILNIFLIFLLVPPLFFGNSSLSQGPFGAAYAMLFSGIASFVIYRIIVIKLENIKPNYLLLRQAIPALIQAVSLWGMEMIVSPKDVLILIPMGIVSIGVYFLSSIAVRETTRGELVKIVKNFVPGKIRTRFRDENSPEKEIMEFQEDEN